MDVSTLKTTFVLVDNASTHIDAARLAHTFIENPIVVQRNRNWGFGSSCNLGAFQIPEADAYFFLNPDTSLPDACVIDKLYTFLKRERPRSGIVAPRLRYPDGSHQETCRRFPKWHTPLFQRSHWFATTAFGRRHADWFLMRDDDLTIPRMVDWVQGSTLMVDGPLFREIGGFDERYFMYFEDTDLCRRCWERGRPVYYLPHTEVIHEYGKASENGKTGMMRTFLTNRMARVHGESWMKYVWKWKKTQV